jgi:hypothetical protein
MRDFYKILKMLVSFVCHALFVGAFSPLSLDITGNLDISYKGQQRMYHVVLREKYHRDKHRDFPAIMIAHDNGGNSSAFASEKKITQYGPGKGHILFF